MRHVLGSPFCMFLGGRKGGCFYVECRLHLAGILSCRVCTYVLRTICLDELDAPLSRTSSCCDLVVWRLICGFAILLSGVVRYAIESDNADRETDEFDSVISRYKNGARQSDL